VWKQSSKTGFLVFFFFVVVGFCFVLFFLTGVLKSDFKTLFKDLAFLLYASTK